MRIILTIAALIFSSAVSGQGIYNKVATNIKQNRIIVDSVIGVPRDTFQFNRPTYQGSYPGDYGRLATKNKKIYWHDSTVWVELGAAIDTGSFLKKSDSSLYIKNGQATDQTGNIRITGPIRGGSLTVSGGVTANSVFSGNPVTAPPANTSGTLTTLGQVIDSINVIRSMFYLTGLATYPDSVLQPSDSYLRAFEKIQGQFNGIIGRYVENQSASYQLGKFTLNGSSTLSNSASVTPLSLQRYSYGQASTALGFRNVNGSLLGYLGLASTNDSNSIFLSSQIGRIDLVNPDTTSVVLSSISPGGTINSYFFYRNGSLFLYRNAVNPQTFDKSIFSGQYKLWAEGYTRLDSVTTAVALLHNRSVTYNMNNDTIDVVSGATNYNYRIKLRRTGGVMYDAFFLKGSNGYAGINTVSPTSFFHVNGSVSITQRTVTGNTTLTDTDHMIIVNNSGTATINLPAASSVSGRVYIVKKVSAALNDVVIDPNGSELFDGLLTRSLVNQWSSMVFVSNGTGWSMISSHVNGSLL